MDASEENIKLTLGPKGLILYDPVSHNYLNRHLRSPRSQLEGMLSIEGIVTRSILLGYTFA